MKDSIRLTNVLLFAPAIKEYDVFYEGTHDGELLYLGQHLYSLGYNLTIVDNYANPEHNFFDEIKEFKPNIIIVHLWKNALLKNNNLLHNFDYLKAIKGQNNSLQIILIGSIANSLKFDILNNETYIDAIISEYSINTKMEKDNCSIYDAIKSYYKIFIKLDEDYLSNIKFFIRPNDIVSIYSSRGCNNTCSFCSYNKESIQWKKREISDVITDMSLLNKYYNVTRFSFFDSNFGTDKNINLQRSLELKELSKNLSFNFSLSLNLSLNGITTEIIDNLYDANVTTILIGLESLDEETLKLYNKIQPIEQYAYFIDYIERKNIVPIISYILFNPYLTFDKLKIEINKIEEFGRFRIIQFMTRSILCIIPKTKIESKIKRDGLLIENGYYRDFNFIDADVSKVYYALHAYFNSNIRKYNSNFKRAADFKIKEWEYLKKLIRENNIKAA